VAARQFREDLYFRLSVLPITIPPLRERGDDVLRLAQHFITKFARDMKRRALVLAPDAVDRLEAYRWPGNVRELQNCIERAVILCDGDRIHARHLSLSFERTPAVSVDPWEAIDLSGSLPDALRRVQQEVERRKIGRALSDQQGDVGRAADVLQVPFRNLAAKIKEYKL
jgi:DNA-binding NtrC family response regulator